MSAPMLMWLLTGAVAALFAVPLYLGLIWSKRPRRTKREAMAYSLALFTVIFTVTALVNMAALTTDTSRGEFG